MTRRPAATVQKLVGILLFFALLSVPLAGYTWDMVNDLISGSLTLRKALTGLPALIVLLIVLRFAARALARIDASSAPAHPDGDR